MCIFTKKFGTFDRHLRFFFLLKCVIQSDREYNIRSALAIKVAQLQNSPHQGETPPSINYKIGYNRQKRLSALVVRGKNPVTVRTLFFMLINYRVIQGSTVVEFADTASKPFCPVFTIHINCRICVLNTVLAVLFTFDIFPVAVTVRGDGLTLLLWRHWGEGQRCGRREALRAVRYGRQGILREGGTPENLLLWGFCFTISNLNVFPYPLCQRRKG